MEKNCFNCKYYDQPSFEMKEYCWECLRQEEIYTRWERKPLTNADRIRAMSDEKLAKWLSHPVKYKDMFPDLELYIAPSSKEWLDWLKQEAE